MRRLSVTEKIRVEWWLSLKAPTGIPTVVGDRTCICPFEGLWGSCRRICTPRFHRAGIYGKCPCETYTETTVVDRARRMLEE